jgi:oligopeptide transport system permease protein
MVSWLDMARIVRGQTLSLKRKEFIEAAQVGGVQRQYRGSPYRS